MDIEKNRRSKKIVSKICDVVAWPCLLGLVSALPLGYLLGADFAFMSGFGGGVGIAALMGVDSFFSEKPRLFLGDKIYKKNVEKWNKSNNLYEVVAQGSKNYLIQNLKTGKTKELPFDKQDRYVLEEKKEVEALPELNPTESRKFINSKVKEVA